MPGRADHLVARARERLALHDYHGAAHLLEEVLAGGQAYADVHHMLGVARAMLRQPERALAEFEAALALNPHYLEAQLHRGVVLAEVGRLDEAEQAFRGAATAGSAPVAGLPAHVAGRLANLHAELGDAYADAGAFDPAIDQYRQAITLGPRFLDLRYRLGRLLLAAGRTLEARDELARVVEANPRFLDAQASLGLACFLSGDTAGAAEVWAACEARHPDDPRVRAYRAMLARVGT